jgi:hypothetical protein
LRAHTLYKRDVDYVVKNGEVIIVDEFTGREMPGRRWSDGLHQAVEAKEGVKIERENQTLATITFQNYFRMYSKLSGMTGTAETEAAEFHKIYGLDVCAIPTNRELRRHEFHDVVYRTEAEKFTAVVNGILQEDGSYEHGVRQTARIGAAGAAGHDLHRKIRTARRASEKSRHSAPGAERQATRARSQSDRAGRAQGLGDGFHQHGGPRHRHPAGRQSRSHDARIFPEKQARDSARGGRGGDRLGRTGRSGSAEHGAISDTRAKSSRCRSISGSRSTTSFSSSAAANMTKS